MNKRIMAGLLAVILLSGITEPAHAQQNSREEAVQDSEESTERDLSFDFDTASDEEIVRKAQDLYEQGLLIAFVQGLNEEQLRRYRSVTDGVLNLMDRPTGQEGKEKTQKRSGSSGTIYVGRDEDPVTYGGLGASTHAYWVEADGDRLPGLCVNASNAGPRGNHMRYGRQDDTSETSIILKGAMVRAYYPELIDPGNHITDPGTPGYNDLVWFWFDNPDETRDSVIVKCHALASWVWAGDLGGFNGVPHFNQEVFERQVQPIKDAILRWYRRNTHGFKDILDSFTLYVAEGTGEYINGIPLQSIAWVERAPEAWLAARKVSAQPSVTDGNAKYRLDGIRFRVYTDQACESRAKDTAGAFIELTSGEDGKTEAVRVWPGTYYVREVEESLNGKGWIYNSQPTRVVVKEEHSSAQKAVIAKVENDIPSGQARIKKISADPVVSAAGGYSLKNIRFNVFTDPECTKEAKAPDGSGIDLVTDETGKTDTVTLSPGTYYVKEDARSVPPEYEAGTAVKKLVIKQGETAELEFVNTPKTGYLRAKKTSADPVITSGNSCYIREGIRFQIYRDQACTQYARNAQGKTFTLKTGQDGVTDAVEVPVGTYWVREMESSLAGKGWQYDPVPKKVIVTAGTEAEAKTAVISNEPLNDPAGLVIRKLDRDGAADQTADLSGARFTVRFYAGLYDRIEKLPQSADAEWVVETKKEGKAYRAYLSEGYVISGSAKYGKSTDGDYKIPLGTLLIRETKAPSGYTLEGAEFTLGNGQEIHTDAILMQIRDEASAVYVIAGNHREKAENGFSLTAGDEVLRGSVVLDKRRDSDGQAMPAIPFRLTALETGETHYFITDQNGHFDSEANRHRTDTNGLDNVLSGYGPADIIPQSVIDRLDPKAGLWFGASDADNGKPALPCGSYLLEELKCDANRSMTMLTKTFVIDRAGQCAKLGTLINREVTLRTTAADRRSGSHYSALGRSVSIVDRVSYGNVVKGQSYEVTGRLMLKERDGTVKELKGTDGKPITKKVAFQAEKANGSIDVPFTIDSSGLAGKQIVIYEELRVEATGEFAAEHKDAEDADQFIWFPSIGTSLKDERTGGRTALAEKGIVLNDTVSYRNLCPGRTYVLKGILMDRDTGEKLRDDSGTMIEAQSVFQPKTSDGRCVVTFRFDGCSLKNRKAVAYETLLLDGREIAVHADPDDSRQTMYFPEVMTSACAEDTGLDHIPAEGEATVVDKVSYRGLCPGLSYTVCGILVDRENGAPLKGMDGEIRAEETFTPEETDGTVELRFTFDASVMAGKTAVVFESLQFEGKEVAVHADLSDEAQTVYIPKISTEAVAEATGEHVTPAGEKTVVKDIIHYEGFRPGANYRMEGCLFVRDTEEKIEGSERSLDFVPETSSGTLEMIFSVDTTSLKGQSIVAAETCFYQGAAVAEHRDPYDEAQTVAVPEIRTEAGAENAEHIVCAGEKTTVTDRIEYRGLLPGRVYTVSGFLMDQNTGEPLKDAKGKEIRADLDFTPAEENGDVILEFVFDGSLLAGTTAVAFETVCYEGVEVAVHADLSDEAQTVRFPAIETAAADADTKEHIGAAAPEKRIRDRVRYENLIPGRSYTVIGTLFEKETGKALRINGEPVLAMRTFEAEKPEGEVELIFETDASALGGQTLVVYETLYLNGTPIAVHQDPDDEGQSVHIPKIRTTAVDRKTEDHVGSAGKKCEILDTVHYQNLLPGMAYTVTGTLIEKESGKPFTVDGRTVTKTLSLVPAKPDGSVTLTFAVDPTDLEGKTLVVFEELKRKDTVLAVHADPEDEEQSVHFPQIRTTASAVPTGDHLSLSGGMTVIRDRVEYRNLVPGREYVLTGILYDRETGQELKQNDAAVTAEASFTPDGPDGFIRMEFEVDSKVLAGKTLVVFEELCCGDVPVARHADISDEEQAVHFPKIITQALAEDTGDHLTQAKDGAVITDVVRYRNLLPGRKYTMHGVLVDADNGNPVLIGGKRVENSVSFEPEHGNGSVTVSFALDASALAGTRLAVFEECLYHPEGTGQEAILIAEHRDALDCDQTIRIPAISTHASDGLTQTDHSLADRILTIVDEVHYRELLPGKTYTMTGMLFDRETSEPVLVDGKTVQESVDFTAEAPDGSVRLEFFVPAEVLRGRAVVVFETCTYRSVPVAVHADLSDADQTDYIPEIRTEAVSDSTDSHLMPAGKEETLTDTVFYSGLKPDTKYTVCGTLIDRKTGEPVTAGNGNSKEIGVKPITASVTFVTPKSDDLSAASGTVELSFTVDTSAMGGKTIVVFERLYLNDNCVAAHEDPEDEGQSIHIPGISTKAENKENGLRTGAEGERLTLVDTVTFCNLIPGQTYVLKGEWMDAAAKKSTGIRKELSFCPDQPNGSVEMIFDADASLLMGKTLVAFECLYDGDGNLIAKHCAYDDRDQTIAVRASTPATGDETETGLQCVIAILSAAALISLAVIAGKIRNACR